MMAGGFFDSPNSKMISVLFYLAANVHAGRNKVNDEERGRGLSAGVGCSGSEAEVPLKLLQLITVGEISPAGPGFQCAPEIQKIL